MSAEDLARAQNFVARARAFQDEINKAGYGPPQVEPVDEAVGLLVQVLTLRPDDSLIFKVDQLVTVERAAEIRKRITPNLPEGMRFLIVGPGVDVTILRQEDQP